MFHVKQFERNMKKFIRKIKLLFTRNKNCYYCCLFCEHWEHCEGDLIIENVLKKRGVK